MRKIILRMTAIAALAAFASHEARADDPLPIMRGILAARYAMISVYQVQPGREATFQAALLQSGPYNRRLQGFANERVLEASTTPMSEGPSSARTVGQRVISLTRCFDAETGTFIVDQRSGALRDLLQATPVYVPVSLVEHIFSNWAWEKSGTAPALTTTPAGQTPSLLVQSRDLFAKPNISLSFLKDGYIGQLGMLEAFPVNASLDDIRGQMSQRDGLMGASIYQSADSTFYVYSEYFQAPVNQRSRALIAEADRIQGAQLGAVVQNYVSR
ncbi:hypothetical protein [Bradyrhizobium barranii]